MAKIGTPEHDEWMRQQEQKFLDSFADGDKDEVDLREGIFTEDDIYDPDLDEDELLEKIGDEGLAEDIERL